MFKADKVLWGDGLFLRPQHFQLQDYYQQQQLNQNINAIQIYAFGIQNLLFDHVQLQLNILALHQICMLWQDGDIYNAPDQDLLPEPLALDTLEMQTEMLVYLALPVVQANKQNLSQQNNSQSGRYHHYLANTQDLFTNAPAADITLLHKQAQFKLSATQLTDQHHDDGFLYLAIAKLKRQNTGHFELAQDFIPALLHLHASERLLQNLKRILNVIKTKIKTIQANNRENEQKLIEFRSGDIVSFWLVNALNTAYASLAHLYQHPDVHPERLYNELLKLTGSLLTFSTAYDVEHLPPYQHLDLYSSFNALDKILRDLLDTIISNRYISIALKEIRPSYWLGSLESDKINRDSRLYLAVSSRAMPSHELIQLVPLRFKVGSSIDVEQRVVSALAAVPLQHLLQVPTAIPVRSGVHYFEIEPHHVLYQNMLQSEAICIYVPNGFQDISLELIAVVNA
ncbi:type VI secretion system baseplate subunit TssK [Acinetobacter larvae]|uniref:Type VI secretion system-associated protein n=1 Tax=Acinetobacter larvae TaxID=1789224 RepID=A0A1B2M0W2_9GAMM|nr:type VI secretion system baseplate subunit TssK [Acinetobacter larvae]AOA58809.1 type VI secretion system-associated protein [Acinetobacter larvae]